MAIRVTSWIDEEESLADYFETPRRQVDCLVSRRTKQRPGRSTGGNGATRHGLFAQITALLVVTFIFVRSSQLATPPSCFPHGLVAASSRGSSLPGSIMSGNPLLLLRLIIWPTWRSAVLVQLATLRLARVHLVLKLLFVGLRDPTVHKYG